MIQRHEISHFGNRYVEYQLNEKLHRPNGPARVSKDFGTWNWMLNGKHHRYYGPRNNWNSWAIHGDEIR